MSRKDNDNMKALYGEMFASNYGVLEENTKVGTVKAGQDLGENSKKVGPSGSGAENTDAVKAVEAPKASQGDTVASSTKKKGKVSFEDLYKQVVKEGAEDIDGPNYDEIEQDFPAGPDEEVAERGMEDEMGGEESIADLFRQFGEVANKIADYYANEEGGMGDGLIGDETGLGDGESLEEESAQPTALPDGTPKVTNKSYMDSKGVKVVRKVATGKGDAKGDGKPEVAKVASAGGDMKVKGNGPAVSGKGSIFED